jgi:NADPH-dependent F420 reductase
VGAGLLDELDGRTVAVIGGTGPQGRGLAYRWAVAGLPVVIGSRNVQRAETVAESVNAMPGASGVRGLANADCAAAADLVLVAVPWEGHAATIEPLRAQLAGKLVVDCVNPIGFDERGPFPLAVPAGSAAAQAAELLPESTVVAAFHHVSAVLLGDPDIDRIDTDVLVLGEDRVAVQLVIELAGLIPGIRGVYGGRLRNAGQVEALTANLIAINRRYRAHAGLRITDI